MAVADLVHGVAVKIHDAPACGVDQVDALGPLYHVQARRRQRLMQEPARILIQQRARLGVDVFALPGGARVAEIDVTLATILHGRMLGGWRARGKRAGIDAWRSCS